MKNIIVITGASSGFGALAARALARAGHIVYASMRETIWPQCAAGQSSGTVRGRARRGSACNRTGCFIAGILRRGYPGDHFKASGASTY